MLLESGQLLDGKYRIGRLLGQGGMGAVYEGHHELIDRRIAIKTLLPSLEQEASIVRFEREARAAGRIGNDHILEIYDIGSLPDGGRYMVMEYLDGRALSDRIRASGRLEVPEVGHIGLQLLNGLGAAHDAGVLHRDLKPDNIFLVNQKAGMRDFVKIIDFGISKFNLGKDEMRMTATGMVVGTPYYIAPEVAKGLGDADHRADIYAVGVILYEALSGRVPFDAENFNNLLFKIVLEEPPHLTTLVPELDPELAALVHKAMARDKTHRFQSCAEFAEALRGWAELKGVSWGPSGITPAPRPSLYSFSDGQSTASLASASHTPAPLGSATIQAPAVGAATPGAFGASQPLESLPKRQPPLGLMLGAGGAAVALIAILVMVFSGEDAKDSAPTAASAGELAGPETSTADVLEAEPPKEAAPPPKEETANPSDASALAGSTPEKPASDQSAPNQPAADKSAAEKPAAEETAAQKPATQTTTRSATAPTAPRTSAPTVPPRTTTGTSSPSTPATSPATTERSRRNFGY
jgi:eukaryotic-like serine/threonine-protein kinase